MGMSLTHLLRYGLEREPAVLLKDFLGRPVSPQALLDNLRRLSPQSGSRSVRLP